MATLPTPEDCGKRILDVFDHFNVRPNEVLMFGNFMAVWHKDGWRAEDYDKGIIYALENGWIEAVDAREGTYRLTEIGYSEM